LTDEFLKRARRRPARRPNHRYGIRHSRVSQFSIRLITNSAASRWIIHDLDDLWLVPEALNDTWRYVEQDLTLVTVPNAGHWVHGLDDLWLVPEALNDTCCVPSRPAGALRGTLIGAAWDDAGRNGTQRDARDATRGILRFGVRPPEPSPSEFAPDGGPTPCFVPLRPVASRAPFTRHFPERPGLGFGTMRDATGRCTRLGYSRSQGGWPGTAAPGAPGME